MFTLDMIEILYLDSKILNESDIKHYNFVVERKSRKIII